MRTLSLLPLLLAACSQPEENAAVSATKSDTIAGVYEGSGRMTMPDRLCLTGKGAKARFGLIMGSDGRRSCIVRGRVNRVDTKLTLAIDGDPACALTGTLTATGVNLGQAQGRECSYFCGAGTQLRAASFDKGSAQAERVTDLVGEPLC